MRQPTVDKQSKRTDDPARTNNVNRDPDLAEQVEKNAVLQHPTPHPRPLIISSTKASNTNNHST